MITGGTSKASGENILGRWSHTFLDSSDFSLQLYYDRTHIAAPKPSNGFAPAGILTDDLDTYDLDFQDHIRLGAQHRLTWGPGLSVTHDQVGNAPAVVFLPAQLDQQLFSCFAQDEIELRKNLSLTLGTKVEHNDYTGYETEPNGRLLIELSRSRTKSPA